MPNMYASQSPIASYRDTTGTGVPDRATCEKYVTSNMLSLNSRRFHAALAVLRAYVGQ